MHPNGKFLLLTSLTFLSIFLLRFLFDKRQAFLARKAWRLQHLTGGRRKVGELFDSKPNNTPHQMNEIDLTKLLSACLPRQSFRLRNGETAYLVSHDTKPTKYPYGTSYSPDGEVNCWHLPNGKCALTELPKWDITDILPPFLHLPSK